MKKIFLLGISVFLSFSLFSQFQVSLKVIDNQDGALTNKVDDNNETNVIVYASDMEDNKLYDNGDWWYAMYSGEAHSPNGSLIKADGVWTWQATFTVAPGDYKWNPHMKTLGWNPINNLYNYAESNDILFSVSADGTITGTTTLELPLIATSINKTINNNITIKSSNKTITIENMQSGSNVAIYDMAGSLIHLSDVAADKIDIFMPKTGIYLVIIDGKSNKVMVR